MAKPPKPVLHTVRRTAPVPIERLFDTVLAEDSLPKMFTAFRMVPAVTGIKDLTGSWDRPGSQRTVLLSNGTTAREQMKLWARPTIFAHEVDKLPRPIRSLATHAVATWRFDGDGETSGFVWTYAYHPRTRLARGAVRAFVGTMWAGYMENCADMCVARARLLPSVTPFTLDRLSGGVEEALERGAVSRRFHGR